MRFEAVLLAVILLGSFIHVDGGAIGESRSIREEETKNIEPEAAQGAGAQGEKPLVAQAGDSSSTVPTPDNSDNNCTDTDNSTACQNEQKSGSIPERLKAMYNEHKGMLMRSFYVLIGVTGIVIIYFIVRTVRLRSRRSKSKKYGVIATSGSDNLEMTPLDQEDDDEDLTVFEVNGRR